FFEFAVVYDGNVVNVERLGVAGCRGGLRHMASPGEQDNDLQGRPCAVDTSEEALASRHSDQATLEGNSTSGFAVRLSKGKGRAVRAKSREEPGATCSPYCY